MGKVCFEHGQGLFLVRRPCPLIMPPRAVQCHFAGQGLSLEIKPCPKAPQTLPQTHADLAHEVLWVEGNNDSSPWEGDRVSGGLSTPGQT